MSGFKEPSFADSQKAAVAARQNILNKFREAEKAEQLRREAELAAQAAAQLTREKEEAASREAALEAERKAARDARYAARKKRK